jgi:hypothetical protein
MMSTCCSKHVEAYNKYIKKECIKLVITQGLLYFLLSRFNFSGALYVLLLISGGTIKGRSTGRKNEKERNHITQFKKQSNSSLKTTFYIIAIPLQASRRLRLPAFLENQHTTVSRLSALRTSRLYYPTDTRGTHFC